ncbi:NAD-dependent epimerase/dehydratase family protein [Maribellus luteus]|uniref:NAD-dependent epimerase/dehydratase family protein n=1 Tax=Maribellus luteus TaxID=2305463 RepID=A0A399T2X8_9BACT|nr:NAD-dependent epimerase/dehydratase family protein [Maribellus luteus]RIJ50178.1 NAD-dependent epimerase/dehydratase family protein [Maribellus luteus]
MKARKKCLVTGANGHLGNNLVKELTKQGYEVRASVRNLKNKAPFEGVDCEVVYADITDKNSLLAAMKDIDVLFHVAAVFKHWAPDAEKEILEPNILGTRNVLEAAAEMNIRKTILVSSIAAIDHRVAPMNEKEWAKDFPNPYYEAKQKAEQLAWKMAEDLKLELITVLPSSMIGPDIYGRLTPSMNVMRSIVKGDLPFDPAFCLNFVDVKDVAKGIVLAEQNGKPGNRYILATEPSVSTTDLVQIAKQLYPEMGVAPVLPKEQLLAIAEKMEAESKITGEAPLLLVGNVEHYYQADARMDIGKARNELGYQPREIEEVIVETFHYLKNINIE